MYFFSAKTLAFYPESMKEIYINAGSLPDDVIEVSDETRNTFNGQPPENCHLGIDSKGMPSWVDTPPPTHEEQAATAELKRQGLLAQAYAITADWRTELALGIISDEDKTKLIAWMQYIKAVKAVDISIVPNIVWPDKPAA